MKGDRDDDSKTIVGDRTVLIRLSQKDQRDEDSNDRTPHRSLVVGLNKVIFVFSSNTKMTLSFSLRSDSMLRDISDIGVGK